MGAATALVWTSIASAQRSQPTTSTRRIANVVALMAYPVFFHTQPVRVRGELSGLAGQLPWKLSGGGREVMVVPGANSKISVQTDGPPKPADLTGVLLDVGRLEPGHPRATQTLVELSERLLKKSWPGPGELIVLVADAAVAAEPLAAPSVRNVALDPSRYAGQEVTVVGRFRGRNLYGDLPDAPGISRWDFVVQSADAAIWVTGRRPRIEDGDLNVERRADTGRWLAVRGTVREDRGLVRIEAVDLRAAQAPPPSTEAEALVQVTEKGPRPEVVFSAPTQDETDVEPTTRIRVQFSRDLDPATLKDQVRAGYVGFIPGDPNWQPPTMTVKYDQGRRMMEIGFSGPLEPFRTVQVRLLEGILGTDGQPLVPWSVSFTVGR
jgi:Bacterial Ig-like domain